MRLSDLLGLQVESESGERLGRVHDVRGELTQRTLWITGLVVGRVGLLERLGIGAPRMPTRVRGRDAIPWSDVVRVEPARIVVRDPDES